MSLDLSPHAAGILEQEASRAGVSVDTLIERTFARPAPVEPVDHVTRVKSLIAELQRADGTPVAPPAPNDGTMTPSEALFHQWEQEAASMTEDEIRAEAELAEQIMQGIDAERMASGMRLLFAEERNATLHHSRQRAAE